MHRITWVLLMVVFLAACGSSYGPTPVNLAGTWSGTVSSTSFSPRPITVTLSQDGLSVRGAWSSSDWTGTISGTADNTTFSGEVSLPAVPDPLAGGECLGTVMIRGDAAPNAVHWTSYGWKGSCKNIQDDTGVAGVAVDLTLHR